MHQWLRDGAVNASHPRFFGLFQPPAGPDAVTADALVALHDPSLALGAAAPLAVALEAHVLRALAARIGWTASLHATFTTGGAEANLTALLLALGRRFPAVRDDGVASLAARPRLYVTAETHASVLRAAQVAGLGRSACREVRCDRAFRMDLRALREAVREDRAAGWAPFFVAATAGTTSCGAVDPVRALSVFARAEDLWLHVDGAFGATALLAPNVAPALDGVAGADSLTWDAHKWLGSAQGAGMLFSPHEHLAAQVFGVDAPYLPGGAHPWSTTLQWSRRAAGAKVFALLASTGWAGMAARVERCVALGQRLRARLLDDGATVFGEGPLPVVAFATPAMRRGAADPARVAARLRREGVAFVTDTRVAGRFPALRACVANPSTADADVDALAEAVRANR